MLEDTINSLSDTHPTISRLTPHLNSHINKQVVQQTNTDDLDVHQSRLSNVLESYRLEAIEVPKDGDCLFTSIARHIEQVYHDHKTSTDSLLNHMQSIGVSATMSTVLLTQHLRELLVHEWLSNQGEY